MTQPDKTRREFLQTGTTAAAATLASSLGSAQSSSSERKPNIVLSLGEGQRADALSLAGNRILRTPNHESDWA